MCGRLLVGWPRAARHKRGPSTATYASTIGARSSRGTRTPRAPLRWRSPPPGSAAAQLGLGNVSFRFGSVRFVGRVGVSGAAASRRAGAEFIGQPSGQIGEAKLALKTASHLRRRFLHLLSLCTFTRAIRFGLDMSARRHLVAIAAERAKLESKFGALPNGCPALSLRCGQLETFSSHTDGAEQRELWRSLGVLAEAEAEAQAKEAEAAVATDWPIWRPAQNLSLVHHSFRRLFALSAPISARTLCVWAMSRLLPRLLQVEGRKERRASERARKIELGARIGGASLL